MIDLLFCTHGVYWELYCFDCDADSDYENDRLTDPNRDFADSVGLPLHEKI